MPERELDRGYGRYEIAGRGTVFTGRAPFYVDKMDPGWFDKHFASRAWVISSNDPATKDQLWRVKGVESWATTRIGRGQPIGLLVEPYH